MSNGSEPLAAQSQQASPQKTWGFFATLGWALLALLFLAVTIVSLAVGYAVAFDVKVVDRVTTTWYAAFYRELATSPRLADLITLIRNTSTDAAITNPPMVATMFSSFQPAVDA